MSNTRVIGFDPTDNPLPLAKACASAGLELARTVGTEADALGAVERGEVDGVVTLVGDLLMTVQRADGTERPQPRKLLRAKSSSSDRVAGPAIAAGLVLTALGGLAVPGVAIATAGSATAGSIARRRALKDAQERGRDWSAIAAALAAVHPEVSRTRRAVAEDRKLQGARFGSAPNRAWGRALPEVLAERDALESANEVATLDAIATALNSNGISTPVGGSAWTRSSVKRALDYGASESLVLLRRLGPLIDDLVDEEGAEFARDRLEQLSREYGVHWKRLYEWPISQGEDHPLIEPAGSGSKFRLTERGKAVHDLWVLSDEIPQDATEAIWKFQKNAYRFGDDDLRGNPVLPAAKARPFLDSLKANVLEPDRFIEAVPQSDTAEGAVGKHFRLTESGLAVRDLWDLLANPDANARYDGCLWNADDDDRDDWDWEDDPFPPGAVSPS